MTKAKTKRTAKRTSRRPHGVVNCNHCWRYEQTVWQARQDDQSRVAVGRYCANCGKLQTAVAKDWRPLPKSYVDMRECLTKNLNVQRKTPSSYAPDQRPERENP